MTKQAIDSENEGKVIYASGHYFQIINGVRRWLTIPPDDYICTDGTNFSEYCHHSDTTQEEWFSTKRMKTLGV